VIEWPAMEDTVCHRCGERMEFLHCEIELWRTRVPWWRWDQHEVWECANCFARYYRLPWYYGMPAPRKY
jgi:hypothetical protein